MVRPRRPGAHHSHQVALGHPGRQRGVDRAGGRLDHDGVLVRQGVRHGVELAGVGHQRGGRPASAGVGAEPGLEPGLQGAEGEVAAETGVPGAHWGHSGMDVAGGAAQHRLDHGPGAGGELAAGVVGTALVEHADHLVARHEREPDHVLEVAGRAPVECGQVGAADARQQRAEREPVVPRASGASASSSCSGPMPAPGPSRAARPPGRRRTVARCARRRVLSPSAPPTPAAGPEPARAAGLVRPRRAAPRRSSGPRGSSGPGAAVGLVPGLHVPAPPAGDGGQLGLGVDRHREADRLQHGQVAGRVGVGHRLLEPQTLGLGVVGQHQGPGLADGRQLSSRPVKSPSSSPSRAQTISSNSGRNGSTTKSRAPVMRIGPVPERLVGPDPGDARREGLGQQQVVEEVPAVVPQAGHRRPVVAAVEGAEEVTAVPPVEASSEGASAIRSATNAARSPARQVPRRQPGVGVDDVGGDEGVLQVEGGEVAVGGEDVLPGPVGPVGLDRLARATCAPGRAR